MLFSGIVTETVDGNDTDSQAPIPSVSLPTMRNLGREFAGIVEQRLKELEKKAFTVETEANLPPDSIRNVMRATNPSGPTLSKAQQICDALDLELYIGPRRRRQEWAGTGGEALAPSSPGTDSYLPIPWHHLSRRPGSSPLSFYRPWLKERDLKPANLRAVDLDCSAITLPFNGELVAVVDVEARKAGPRSSWAVQVDGRNVAATVEFFASFTVVRDARADGSSAFFPIGDPGSVLLYGKIRWLGVLATG